MQSRMGFQYIAGLWREAIILDLLWSTSWQHYNTTPTKLAGKAGTPRYENRPVTLISPSWSCAPTPAAISFALPGDVGLHDQCAMVKDINCKAEGDNLFEEVIHGSLQLVGLLRQMRFKCGDPREPYF
ncbi:hypothetical protein QL093DRAFT_2558891 [Fusarium oxysporum]|nr:hypothetical protein QL093DRAFT_2558891 [Fusarium oxysporum]